MAELPVWGIHVTTASIRGVKLARDGERLVVLAHDQYDFAEDIEDINSLERHAALAHALFVFGQRHDLSTSRVVVSVDAASAFNRYVATPVVEGESMARLMEYEAQQQIPFELEGVFWDYKILDVERESNIAHVMLVAARREVVEERLRRLTKVRFPADQLQLAPIAVYNYAYHEGMAKNGFAVISVDYDRCDIVIAHERRFWFRSLPTGVFSFIEAIREEIEPNHRRAVRLARREEKADDPAAFSELREAYAERLGSELARMIEYYRGSLRDVDLKGIVLVPGNRMVPPIGKYLKQATGLDVFAVKGFRNFDIDEAISTPELEKSVGPLGHAVGLALQGLGAAEVDLRLHEAGIERDVGVRKIFWVLTILVLFMIVVGTWWSAQGNVAALEAEHESVDEILGETEVDRLKFQGLGSETRLRDLTVPFLEGGRDRLVPVAAFDMLLEVLAEAAAGRSPEDIIYLVEAETRPGMISEGREASRSVRMILGTPAGADAGQARARIQRVASENVGRRSNVSALSEVRNFTASALASAPAAVADGAVQRRRFVMVEYTFLFAVAAGSGDGQ